MKILQLIASVDPRGGGPTEALKQVTHVLLREGHECHALSLDNAQAPWVKNFPFTLHTLPGVGRYRYSPKLVPWLKENSKRYDCVIVRGLWRYTTYGTWRAMRRSDTPYFVFSHGMLDPWFQETYPLKHIQKSLLWIWAEHRVLRDARAVMFTSEEERVLAQRSFRPYRCREEVVRYGTAAPPSDLERLREEFFESFPGLRERRVLLFLGRIHKKKGCDLLIEALGKLPSRDPSLELVIAGPDETMWKQALTEKAKEYGVQSCITWTGMLTGNLKWGALAAAEVFILPSHQENFGISVVEAMACRVPVLISNRVNIWREIEESGAGIVENDNLEGTIRLIQRWDALSESQREEMRKKAEQCFLEKFEINEAAKHLIEVITAYSK